MCNLTHSVPLTSFTLHVNSTGLGVVGSGVVVVTGVVVVVFVGSSVVAFVVGAGVE